MTGALVILAVLIVVGIVLYIGERLHNRRLDKNIEPTVAEESGDDSEPEDDVAKDDAGEAAQGECCGMHLVCEKDTLSPVSAEILYYDDEELDRFIGRPGDDYTPGEVEEFRDVLMTLRPEDVSGWARSITQRHLELPPDVRDELLILVNEQRSAKSR